MWYECSKAPNSHIRIDRSGIANPVFYRLPSDKMPCIKCIVASLGRYNLHSGASNRRYDNFLIHQFDCDDFKTRGVGTCLCHGLMQVHSLAGHPPPPAQSQGRTGAHCSEWAVSGRVQLR